ncbi:MAG TPA: ubiquitin-like protein Pup [Candidatus Nesterenkonia stercoripullorum]|uniref:Prokaryotic ubiquitin-like protein Pup n=1 Tax=Candidatus Nesterenkonia stercoripullorum TaxID=2838701 RepID=A0A9D1URU0_9MICC|nr:ubiquitin-like protein Pup [Candidatus Nesterenkonia stercoripullorum]
MSTQPQKQGPSGPGAESEETGAAPGAGNAQAQKQAAELDSLLDEIDSVLETNAEEFVKGFVQKGGQ